VQIYTLLATANPANRPQRSHSKSAVGPSIQKKGAHQKMPHLKELSTHDIPILHWIQEQSHNSFSLLHSTIGYTQTEWKSEKKQGSGPIEQILFIDDTPIACLRLKSIDTHAQSAELQVHILQYHPAIKPQFHEFLKKTYLFDHLSRFYCFLFPHETQELKLLNELEFEIECIQEHHIYVKGEYFNLLTLGNTKWRPSS